MIDLGRRIKRLRPELKAGDDWIVESDGATARLVFWKSSNGARPTNAELLAVDLTQPTAEQLRLQAVKQILKDDVPDAWRTSTNQMQRVAWALKMGLIELRRDFLEGGV